MYSSFTNPRQPMKRGGKKVREWNYARARVKRYLFSLGITACELRYQGCWFNNALSIAHGRKRRLLLEGELEHLTILICTPCHDILERKPPEAMLAIVQSVIAEREGSNTPQETR